VTETTLNDPQVRATKNRWYLYFSRDPMYGDDGRVRAVIEEVGDEMLNGDGGPKRHRRTVYLEAGDVAAMPAKLNDEESAAYDGLDKRIENELDDAAFQRLIDDGTIIPITGKTH
jgi:hypothetical protein